MFDSPEETEVSPVEDVNPEEALETEPIAEVVEEEPEEINYQKLAVSHMDAKDVRDLHTRGKLTDDDMQRYVVERQVRENFWEMGAANIKYAHEKGIITDRQLSMYVDYRKNPIQFQAKDMLAGAATGVIKLGENVGQVLDQLVTSIVNPVRMYKSGAYNIFEADITGKESFAPGTAKGKVTEVLSQFLIPFLGEAKLFATVTGGAKISTKLLTTKAGKALMGKAPKLAKFIAKTVENAALGMGTDFIAFDPFEPAITEFLEEVGVLPEYMTFMKADEDDPIAWARLKRSMEGAVVGMGIGFALDTILGSLKFAKATAMKRHYGNPDKIAKDGMKVVVEPEIIEPKSLSEVDKAAEAEAIKETSTLNKAVKTDEAARVARLDKETVKGERGISTAKEVKGTDKTQAAMHPQSAKTRAEAAKAVEFIKVGKAGKWEFDTSINFDKIHAPEEVIAMLRFQAKQSAEAVKKVKGGTLTEVKLSAQSAKIANEFGKHSPTSVLQFTQEKLGITGLHESAQFVNGLTDYVLALDKEIIKLVKHGTDQADMLKAQYLAEMSGQMLKYLDTASTDAGRLLWSFKRMRKGRQSLMNLSKEELTELGGLSGNEKLLKIYADLKDPTMRRKLAVKAATGRIQQGVLEFVQATLVWGMNTFRVNITGNAMAMTSKAVNQFVGVAGDAIVKGDIQRFTGEAKAYFNGLREGWTDSLRFAKGEKMGKVWKAWKTSEAQLDASAKFEGQNLHVLKHYTHQAAKVLGIADKGINIADIYTMSFRNLTATDELFKNLNYHTQKQTAIYREAYEQHGKDSVSRLKAIDEMNTDLPDSIHRESWDNARKNTYTETPSTPTRWMLKGTNLGTEVQFGNKVFSIKPFFWLRIVAMPFVNIADNLMRFAGRHTIFSIPTKGFMDMYRAGGARRGEALARVMSGTSLIGAGYYLHDKDKITGMIPVGDGGKSMYNNWKNRNVTPYSLINKVDKRITSYAKFAPAALLVALGANMSTAFEMFGMKDELHLEWDDLIGKVMLPALIDPVLEQHYLKSIREISDVLMQPERTDLTKATINQVPKLLPFSMLITQAKTDLISLGWSEEQATIWVKEVNSVMDKIKQVYDEDDLLPMRHAVYGTKIPQIAKSAGALTVGATQRQTDAFTPGTVEYEMGINRINVGAMPNKIALNTYDRPIELTPKQYDELLENLEELDMKGKLQTVIESDGYQNEPPDDEVGKQTRRIIMQELITKIRSAAKAQFIKDNPALIKEFKFRMETKFDVYKSKKTVHKKKQKELKEFINAK